MNLTVLLRQYTEYNLWANKHMSEWLKTFKDEHFAQEIESSFSSVQKTILHICDAQYVWYLRLTGQEMGIAPSKLFFGGKAEALQLLHNYSVSLCDFVNTISEEDVMKKLQYKHNFGQDTTAIYYMLHHCMNHSTYHRGQLVTLGRQLGYENPPKTDFIHFVREKTNLE